MESTERAVTRLTEPHTEIAGGGHSTEWPPLLDWLDNAIREQVKRGSAGGGGSPSPIDLTALALFQRIEYGVRQMREALYLPIMRDVKGAIREAWDAAKTYRASGEMDDDQQWERICDAFPRWVADIETEWDDRTRRMEMTVPCPSCGTRWVLEKDDPRDPREEPKRRSAVWVEFAEGRAPVGECRALECGAYWVGYTDMAKLGIAIGATPDAEVLAACGIELRQLLAS